MAREVEQIIHRFLADRRGGRLDLGGAEFEVRAAMPQVGSVLLAQLLNGDHGGQSGPRIACGRGHHAEFVDYRSQQGHTIRGDVPLRRAYYHCAECPEDSRRGGIPKDQELDVVGTSCSPGMRRLMARVGAQAPFDAARRDLAEVAGVGVHTKAVERSSEAVGVGCRGRQSS